MSVLLQNRNKVDNKNNTSKPKYDEFECIIIFPVFYKMLCLDFFSPI